MDSDVSPISVPESTGDIGRGVLTSTPNRSVRAIITCDSTWEKGPCHAYNDFFVSATTPKNNSQGKTFV